MAKDGEETAALSCGEAGGSQRARLRRDHTGPAADHRTLAVPTGLAAVRWVRGRDLRSGDLLDRVTTGAPDTRAQND